MKTADAKVTSRHEECVMNIIPLPNIKESVRVLFFYIAP